ncbi:MULTISPECIES: helix-turn-helix domain-containing protein [Pelosinus]|jgi:transcriptional regulator with XRE-family HTH domain|uniref:Helix-turn-helix domain protein n=2 Tax=Pelosinus fermentans TaxID=365349 RepID=I9NVA4_9FIRM|nr:MULTISPECIES: helix-turn-helix transcriptional regulator [Pelosinus]AJQ29126.1 helix-turn-helix domain protein [Pelosinus fermentans JBW45]EIW16465.1 helix-turn-helix domain protein [Pelosinus fermentans B4]EIW22554.1 helix-turn-helix domain protein [Pelosinus fermentans A11]OAM95772.1 helix-turn-helix domain protein [Pelosinus fermentans DSM 17108]SDR32631.1 Helix-turn-helix [Pelosinus fermentans]
MFKKELFIERLNLLMKKNQTSKQALGNAIGVSRPAISQFASGSNLPSIEKLAAIADHFDVSIDYLVGQSDDPKRK